jgi:hypothetical protein
MGAPVCEQRPQIENTVSAPLPVTIWGAPLDMLLGTVWMYAYGHGIGY